jgi:hypothetical protein
MPRAPRRSSSSWRSRLADRPARRQPARLAFRGPPGRDPIRHTLRPAPDATCARPTKRGHRPRGTDRRACDRGSADWCSLRSAAGQAFVPGRTGRWGFAASPMTWLCRRCDLLPMVERR